MGDIVPLFRCKCGVMAKRVDVVKDGHVEASGFLCEACIAAANGMLDRVRPIFDSMIAAGIDRVIANDTMTFLLGRIDP